ncbi:MAG: HAMP domain-containing sensor histidine kinase [Candidatus Omnitrophica bacterium]|nr:HAMP domain-containing sensor histidine kinase [Candidatus Omnitrophota bacterium]
MEKIFFFLEPLGGTIVLFFITILMLVMHIVRKNKAILFLTKERNHLNATINDLDQQAKLIIKSDMEVKLYQQEIESELNKLTLVENLILSSIHILDKDKLLLQVDEKVIAALDFRKSLILDFKTLEEKVNIGFEAAEIEAIKSILQYKKDIMKDSLIVNQDSEIYKQLALSSGLKNTLIAPLKTQEEVYAMLIVSELTNSAEIKKSQREAFLIICMYLGQCLENIRLFENLYVVKDDLEKKIKERTNELVKSLREIEVISKAKSDFISSVSHELRTPLTSVKGFSSLLADERFGKLPQEAKQRLLKIDENVNKLMEIVNTLLDISRIESGKMELKISTFDIVRLIKEVTDFLSPQIEEKNLQLSVSLPEKINVFMDKNLIERVLINIINNAIKFTPEKGKITVKCEKGANETTVSIADTGYGMSKEDSGKIFQEFFRAANPESSKVKGTGLGLSLVKRIIETHKEKIWVESEINKGTVFYFTLKCAN